MATRGVNVASQWAEGQIAPNGHTREARLSALRKKIHEHGNSKAHVEVVKILETAKKAAQHECQNKRTCVDIGEHISSQMKQKLLKKIIENKSKITVLADESTSTGHKSTLIVYMRSSVDGMMDPIAFPLDLVELDSLSAAHIKDKIMACLLKNGFTIELLQEVLIGFCSDGASVMLGTKSGVGKLLQNDFPGIVLWHCLNHRLELAVDQALEVTGGTNDFQAFLDSLYSLYSQSPKNIRDLSTCAHDLHITLKKIGKVFNVRWLS
ncbi:LOW QUALITY PROTEIN: E3 SUMO-protein ligase KIAA1586-like [Halichoeres trimaculatus]|uniref:LOW QUALITY PROTEIN: E3 SUMO-protein ligase KIAA1586-like n=1 Tax=Halichoeres trimaculatus TaxID=147232 RepID=UPI003D9E0946